jgi:hypothetical protein
MPTTMSELVRTTRCSRQFPAAAFLVGMRLYAPSEAFFDKRWKPDDIVKAN